MTYRERYKILETWIEEVHRDRAISYAFDDKRLATLAASRIAVLDHPDMRAIWHIRHRTNPDEEIP